jgi:hypothetical protein
MDACFRNRGAPPLTTPAALDHGSVSLAQPLTAPNAACRIRNRKSPCEPAPRISVPGELAAEESPNGERERKRGDC